jgi:hypothetical protein
MTRKRWADLRDAYLDTPERLAARERARQKLDEELAEYALQHPDEPPTATGLYQFMDAPWPRPEVEATGLAEVRKRFHAYRTEILHDLDQAVGNQLDIEAGLADEMRVSEEDDKA